MRKRCGSCGFICFQSDKICKKCGSAELIIVSVAEDLPPPARGLKPLTFRSYLFRFGIAMFIEFLALCPILIFVGTHGKATSDGELNAMHIVFVAHLPSSLLALMFINFGFNDFMLLAPLAQVAFWTWLLIFIARKRRQKLQ